MDPWLTRRKIVEDIGKNTPAKEAESPHAIHAEGRTATLADNLYDSNKRVFLTEDTDESESVSDPAQAEKNWQNYKIDEKIAFGAESVLYGATSGDNRYCVKAIRGWVGRLLGPSEIKEQGEKRKVSYSAKVRHIKNEFDIGKKLCQSGNIPVVRMYGLRRIKPCFLELGYDLLMEYVDGNDLGDKRALKMLSLQDKIDFFYQTAIALRYMHQNGFVHLDMKPSNIMVSKGVVKLIDFGVTVPLGEKLKSLAGTAGYFSPEQIVRETVNEATDVFALGVTFAVIFGGHRLRQSNDDIKEKTARMEAKFHLDKSEEPLVLEVPEAHDIPKLEQLIRRCTIPKREARIKHTTTIINSLRRIAKEMDIKLTSPY